MALVFVVAAVICFGVITSVRNVNVEYIYYSDRGNEEYELALGRLNGLKGSTLMSLGDDDVYACVQGQNINIKSYEKVFPCTLNVVLCERLEQYARPDGKGGYDVYDINGVYMGTRSSNVNPADDSPNVLLEVEDGDFDAAVAICGWVKEYFGSLRNLVNKVTKQYDAITETSRITLSLYSGLNIVLVDYEDFTESKVSAAAEVFLSLSDSQKLRGSIYSVNPGDSQSKVSAYYNALI